MFRSSGQLSTIKGLICWIISFLTSSGPSHDPFYSLLTFPIGTPEAEPKILKLEISQRSLGKKKVKCWEGLWISNTHATHAPGPRAYRGCCNRFPGSQMFFLVQVSDSPGKEKYHPLTINFLPWVFLDTAWPGMSQVSKQVF